MRLVHALIALAAAPSVALAQIPWWQRTVVVSRDSSALVEVREGLFYATGGDTTRRMDLYRPASRRGQALPAVIFVHGGPVSGLPVPIHRIGQFTSYGRLVASQGVVAVTFSHRLSTLAMVDSSAADIRDALAYVVGHATTLGIDSTRLCLWVVSGGGAVVGPALRAFGRQLRCAVFTYTFVDPAVFRALGLRASDPHVGDSLPLSPMLARGTIALPPTLLVRAGRDYPQLNAALDQFVATALGANADLEVLTYPEGAHSFDVSDVSPRSRSIIGRAVEFALAHLRRD